MIYLAAPYSHESPAVVEARYAFITRVAGELMKSGQVVFSPVTHSHVIAIYHDMPRDWQFWRDQDLAILKRCDSLTALLLPGWSKSVGMTEEIRFARVNGMPVEYLEPDRLPEPLCYEYPDPARITGIENANRTFGN